MKERNNSLEKLRLRALVVDDFLPLREAVCRELRNIPELQLIAEASDGLEAVQQAQELLPDLVVLDIGLPKLNGIEAARQILKLSPHSRILFLSQESSPAMIEEALATGARGYMIKLRIETELLPVVNAILYGEVVVVAK